MSMHTFVGKVCEIVKEGNELSLYMLGAYSGPDGAEYWATSGNMQFACACVEHWGDAEHYWVEVFFPDEATWVEVGDEIEFTPND